MPLNPSSTLTSLLLASSLLAPLAGAAEYPAPSSVGDPARLGTGIQRSMTLLATSTPERRHTVRILFYGQSITGSPWADDVRDRLRARFPEADLVIENRAIGGFSSGLLVKTAETDLYSFAPDLLIFHVYGSHNHYEDIIRRTRERTTAEVLIQTDHFGGGDKLDEPTDPAGLTPAQWTPWFNRVFLPQIAKDYGVTVTDQRDQWRHYLAEHSLQPSALLSDGVHLNDHGRFLMGSLVNAWLVYRPELKEPLAQAPYDNEQVRTYLPGKGLAVKGEVATLEFDGNRVDLVAPAAGLGEIQVRIDGRSPAEFPELYGLTRTSNSPGSGWPCILLVGNQAPRVAEQWTLTLTGDVSNPEKVAFRLEGSLTGPDGEGRSDERFVSRSGRVVIEPGDWNLVYASKVFKAPLPEGFQIKWSVVPRFVERATVPPATRAGVEPALTIVQGLKPGRHTLELRGPGVAALKAVRVYHPPLHGK